MGNSFTSQSRDFIQALIKILKTVNPYYSEIEIKKVAVKDPSFGEYERFRRRHGGKGQTYTLTGKVYASHAKGKQPFIKLCLACFQTFNGQIALESFRFRADGFRNFRYWIEEADDFNSCKDFFNGCQTNFPRNCFDNLIRRTYQDGEANAVSFKINPENYFKMIHSKFPKRYFYRRGFIPSEENLQCASNIYNEFRLALIPLIEEYQQRLATFPIFLEKKKQLYLEQQSRYHEHVTSYLWRNTNQLYYQMISLQSRGKLESLFRDDKNFTSLAEIRGKSINHDIVAPKFVNLIKEGFTTELFAWNFELSL